MQIRIWFGLSFWQEDRILAPSLRLPPSKVSVIFWQMKKCVHDLLNSDAITEILCQTRSSRSRGFCRNIDPFPACTLNIRSTSVCRSIVYLEMTPSPESILLSEERCCCGPAYWMKNNAFYKVTSRLLLNTGGCQENMGMGDSFEKQNWLHPLSLKAARGPCPFVLGSAGACNIALSDAIIQRDCSVC